MKTDSVKLEKSCGAIVWQERDEMPQVLLIRHKNGGHWAFPKGHVEKNETEEETALREIREETGLKVRLNRGFRQVVTYSPKPQVMKDVIYFAAIPTGGSLKRQKEEVEEIAWATLAQALKVVTFESDRQVLRDFIAYVETMGL